MEREGATELAKEFRAAAYSLGYLDAECVVEDRLRSAKEDCDHLQESVIGALCEDRQIPIDERLPECEQTIVVWTLKYDTPRVMQFFYGDAMEWFAGAHNDTLSRENVTHWMPLPEGPPEETPSPPTDNQGAPLQV